MFSQALHRQIFLFGLTVLVVGLSLGAIFISIGQIIISANWILERNFSEKFNQIKTQKIAWPYFLFFGLHLLGLLWTENLTSGVDDIKIKLPILALPLIFSSTRPLSNQELSNLLKIYLFALLAASLWSLFFYLGWKKTSVNDVRNLSRFFSHIRFSMHIVFGIFLSLWFYGETENKIIKIAFALISIWLVFFLFILSSLTGIVLLLILLIGYSIYFFLTFKNLKLKLSIFLVLILGIAGIGIYGYQVYRDFFTPIQNQNEKLELWTSHRDLYYHESNLARENGYFVWRYNAYEEIQASWNKKSNLNFDGVDKNGNPLRFTLIRYMTSKGLRKDEDDFSKLSNEDIRNIENGITNYKLAKASPIKQRIYEATWEMNDFIENKSMRDHSMIVRLEYWKTAIRIIKENWLIGVGTGDVQLEFNRMYERNNSVLKTKVDRKRAHNQFLETLVSHGIIGFISLFLVLIVPFFYKKRLHVLFFPVYIISILSFFTEDTLETQAGVTLFAFFSALFLLQVNPQKYTNKLFLGRN